MSRTILEPETLENLIPRYYVNKQEENLSKKLASADNTIIKDIMRNKHIDIYTVGDITATITIKKSESFNEDKLIDILKKHNIPGLVKMREYVDMDALEGALYHNLIPDEVLVDMASCKEVKTTETLNVKKSKNKEGER